MQLLASPFSAESRHTDAPSSCSFAIYTFIHIFNHLYCRERSEWVNETDVGSWKAHLALVLALNHIVILILSLHVNLRLAGVSRWEQKSTWKVRGHQCVNSEWSLIGTALEPCLHHSLCCACRTFLSEWTITSRELCALSQSCITQPWLRLTEQNLSLDKLNCLLVRLCKTRTGMILTRLKSLKAHAVHPNHNYQHCIFHSSVLFLSIINCFVYVDRDVKTETYKKMTFL